MKQAFTDGKAFITDLDAMPVKVNHLLSDEYAKARAETILEEASDPEPYELPKGGTVYLATADEEGKQDPPPGTEIIPSETEIGRAHV